MHRLVRLVSLTSATRGSDYDDFADRLSSRYTVVILVAFALLVSMNQYVRNPITCWTPNHFSGAHTRYTARYCWIRNTYYLPWSTDFPPIPGMYTPSRRQVTYYQWIPFILLTQAVLFYAPTVIWRAFNSKAGVDADSLLEASQSVARTSQPEARDRTLRTLSKHFDRFLGSRRDVTNRKCCRPGVRCLLSMVTCRFCGRRMGSYLLTLYLFSKLCYIANVVGQLFVLNKVFAMTYSTFGIDMIRNVIDAIEYGRDWTEDVNYVAFPRVTLCDMRVRGQDVGNVQPYTVQCVLPINAYNEKIYAFLWFWMLSIAAISSLSFLLWACRALAAADRVRFIENHVQLGGRIQAPHPSTRDLELVRKFSGEYLRQDGAFLLRLIAHNTDNITTTELICALWDGWTDDAASSPGAADSGYSADCKRLYPHPSQLNGKSQ